MRIKIILVGVLFTVIALAATYKKGAKSAECNTSSPVGKSETKVAVSVDDSTTKLQTGLYYFVHNRNDKTVGKSTLENAIKMEDLIKYYPNNWIVDYESVTVYTTSHGKQQNAESKNGVLTSKQKELLSTADMFTDVVLQVRHKEENSITKELVDSEIIYKMKVSPDTEATYPDGAYGLEKYLRESTQDEVEKLSAKIGFIALVYFTIDEEGNVVDVKVSESLEYKGIEDVLLQVVSDMPTWKPAKDGQGNPVKQTFEYVFGFGNHENGGQRGGGC